MNRERLGFGLLLIIIAVVTFFATTNTRPAPADEFGFATVTPSPTTTEIPSATPITRINSNDFQLTSDENSCTFPTSEWLKYQSAWDFDSIRLGSGVYTRLEVQDILQSESNDVNRDLLRQLLTLVLNQRNGANPEIILQDIENAIQWVEDHPEGAEVSPQDSKTGMELAARLTDFNTGNIGPGRCKFALASPTPTITFTPQSTLTPTATVTATSTATRRPVQFVRTPTSTTKTDRSNDRPTSTPVPPPPEPTEEPTQPIPTSAPTSAIP